MTGDIRNIIIPLGIAGALYGISVRKEHPDLSLLLIVSLTGVPSFLSLMGVKI